VNAHPAASLRNRESARKRELARKDLPDKWIRGFAPEARVMSTQFIGQRSGMDLSVCIERCDDDTVVSIAGEIDVGSGPWLRDLVLSTLGVSGRRLLLDLSRVTFIDCTGLRLLLATCRGSQLLGCPVRLIALSRQVERATDLLEMRELLPLSLPGAGRHARPVSSPASVLSAAREE
jgi:anti-sigma B factor antagonist